MYNQEVQQGDGVGHGWQQRVQIIIKEISVNKQRGETDDDVWTSWPCAYGQS